MSVSRLTGISCLEDPSVLVKMYKSLISYTSRYDNVMFKKILIPNNYSSTLA